MSAFEPFADTRMISEKIAEPFKNLTGIAMRFANGKILSLQLDLNDVFCGIHSKDTN